MAAEDIIAGLRNAIERGSTLEQAIQSFINAGYNPAEVKQAGQAFSQGATQIIDETDQTPPQIQSRTPQQTLQNQSQQIPQPVMQNRNKLPVTRQTGQKKSNLTITILIVTLLVLIGALITSVILGKEFIQDLFTLWANSYSNLPKF